MDDEKFAKGAIDGVFGLALVCIFLTMAYILAPLYTLAVALTGWVVHRMQWYWPSMSPAGVILVSVVSWIGSCMLLTPWVITLGLPWDKALVALGAAGMVLGLSIGQRLGEVDQETTLHQPAVPFLLGVSPQMLAPDPAQEEVPTLEELFTTGVVLGVDVHKEQ